jgi:hypothetical protein
MKFISKFFLYALMENKRMSTHEAGEVDIQPKIRDTIEHPIYKVDQ